MPSCHSPPSSGIYEASSPREVRLIGYFLFLNPRDGFKGKSKVSVATSKVTLITFVPHSDATFEHQQVVLTVSMWLNKLNYFHGAD